MRSQWRFHCGVRSKCASCMNETRVRPSHGRCCCWHFIFISVPSNSFRYSSNEHEKKLVSRKKKFQTKWQVPPLSIHFFFLLLASVDFNRVSLFIFVFVIRPAWNWLARPPQGHIMLLEIPLTISHSVRHYVRFVFCRNCALSVDFIKRTIISVISIPNTFFTVLKYMNDGMGSQKIS